MLGGVLLAASGAIHSLVGWSAFSAEYVAKQGPGDLLAGLAVPWHFAGAAMVTFGCIVISTFFVLLRGGEASLLAVRWIALAYLAFGCWVFAAVARDPTALLFVVPGLLVLAASWRPLARPPSLPRT